MPMNILLIHERQLMGALREDPQPQFTSSAHQQISFPYTVSWLPKYTFKKQIYDLGSSFPRTRKTALCQPLRQAAVAYEATTEAPGESSLGCRIPCSKGSLVCEAVKRWLFWKWVKKEGGEASVSVIVWGLTLFLFFYFFIEDLKFCLLC